MTLRKIRICWEEKAKERIMKRRQLRKWAGGCHCDMLWYDDGFQTEGAGGGPASHPLIEMAQCNNSLAVDSKYIAAHRWGIFKWVTKLSLKTPWYRDHLTVCQWTKMLLKKKSLKLTNQTAALAWISILRHFFSAHKLHRPPINIQGSRKIFNLWNSSSMSQTSFLLLLMMMAIMLVIMLMIIMMVILIVITIKVINVE